MRRLSVGFLAALLTIASVVVPGAAVYAVPVTPGNLVIYRVGASGGAALNNTATAVFLDEYTTAGALVQSIPVTTTGTSALTAVGNATTEGIISPSQDGTALVYTGYRKDAGGANPSADSYATTARVVGTLTLAGTPDTSTSVINDNGATTANTIRSATTVGSTTGSAVWIGNSARVSYNGSGLGTSGGTTQIDARNSRQVNVANNVVYASNGSTAITEKVQSYGTLPTGATTPTPVVSLATGDAVNGFALFDVDPGVAGPDTLYALSTVASQLIKYSFDGSTWTARGSISSVAAANLTGVVNGSSVTLYLTTTSALQTLTDSSGFAQNITGAIANLATAGTNTGFRGIGILFAPVPEPGAVLFGGLAFGMIGLAMAGKKLKAFLFARK